MTQRAYEGGGSESATADPDLYPDLELDPNRIAFTPESDSE